MSGKKNYFPNNWKEYKDAPDDMFETHTFEEIMTWKVANWELPSSVCCLIRVKNNRTGKIQEHVYQKEGAARNKVDQLMHTPDIEFTVCNHEAIHMLATRPIDD